MGYNGNINSFIFENKQYQETFYFKYKIFLKDSKEFDINFIKNNIINNNINIINFIQSIIKINNLELESGSKNNLLNNIEIVYDSYISLFKDFIIYDINDLDNTNMNTDLLNAINNYKKFKSSYGESQNNLITHN